MRRYKGTKLRTSQVIEMLAIKGEIMLRHIKKLITRIVSTADNKKKLSTLRPEDQELII